MTALSPCMQSSCIQASMKSGHFLKALALVCALPDLIWQSVTHHISPMTLLVHFNRKSAILSRVLRLTGERMDFSFIGFWHRIFQNISNRVLIYYSSWA